MREAFVGVVRTSVSAEVAIGPVLRAAVTSGRRPVHRHAHVAVVVVIDSHVEGDVVMRAGAGTLVRSTAVARVGCASFTGEGKRDSNDTYSQDDKDDRRIGAIFRSTVSLTTRSSDVSQTGRYTASTPNVADFTPTPGG